MKELTNRAMSLLSQISALNKKHEEIATLTGRKFNVFSILGMERRETSSHSAFLVELLNPRGQHGQKGLFLKLFLETIMDQERNPQIPTDRIPILHDVDLATVEKEKYLGPIRNEETEGGFADIVINHPRNSICIENKIYAGDQKKQLIRYHNYYVNGEKGGLLLYLTLFGNDASSLSTHSETPQIARRQNEDYFIISYKKDILNWLQKCQAESIDVPTVREVIGQYIYLIKKLTGQGMGMQEREESISLITKFGELHGEDDLIALKQAFDVFLTDIGQKLVKLQDKLQLGQDLIRKPTEFWNKNDQLSHLNSVLFIPLKSFPNGIKKDLKIRVSPKGWTFELWCGRDFESVLREIEHDKLTIGQIADEVTKAVKEQVNMLGSN